MNFDYRGLAELAREEARAKADNYAPRGDLLWHEHYKAEVAKNYIDRISPIGYWELIQAPAERTQSTSDGEQR